MTPVEAACPDGSRWSRSRALIARAGGVERIVYSSIARAILRKPAVPTGAAGFRYHGGAVAIFVIFIALSALELVVLDLVLQRWLVARIVIDVLDAWGLVWMIGLLCAHLVRPHTVGPDGIRVRDGLDLDVAVSWDAVYSVGIMKHSYEPKTPRIIAAEEGVVLAVKRGDATNLEIVLERPTTVCLPGGPPKRGNHDVRKVCLWADDPRAFLAEARKYL